LPDIISKEDVAGSGVFFKILMSFVPSKWSKNTDTVVSETVLFDNSIPIIIDSNAVEPAPAGTA